jgi:PAS domain S-box-containing protein
MLQYPMSGEQAGIQDCPRISSGISEWCARWTSILQIVAIPLFFACFEATKELFAHGLTKWESHFLSIGMVTIISVMVVSVAHAHLARARRDGRHVEEALQTSLQRYRLFAENVADVIWTMDFAGRITYTSPSVRLLLGYTPEEYVRLTIEQRCAPSSAILARRHIETNVLAANDTGRTEPGRIELEMLRKDGSTVWCEVGYGGTYDVSGKIVAFAGVTRDVSERKQAQQRQARLPERLEGMNRLQEELLVPGMLEEKFKKITAAAVRLLDLDFCRIWRVKPGDLCKAGCVHAAATEEGRACLRHDKCLHLVASSGRYTHTNGPHGRVPLGCYKIGRIAYGEAKKFITNNVTTDPQVGDHAWAKSLGLVSFVGYRLNDAAGTTVGVMAMFAKHPVGEEDDAFLSNLAETTSKVIIDHEAEEQLRQAQKMEAVGLLAGGMAHEFNNLLQAISGYTRFAMKGLFPEDQRYDDLQEVCKATDRASTLTRQLLGFSRRSALQPKCANPNDVVRDLAKMVRPLIGEQILLEVICDDDLGTLWADAGQLQQALLNLCLNARDAMPSGGKLLLKTESVVLGDTSWDYGFHTEPGRYAVFTVADTGCGMTPEVRQRIFEPFFTTKGVGKGTGLGLPMVYGTVQQHKGAIHVYSEPGKGATFKVFLPLTRQNHEADAVEEAPLPPRGTETILLAEDEEMVRGLAVRILQRAGYTVLAASDGEEALCTFMEKREAIALVILDAVMPKLTGQEVYRRIQDAAPRTKVIFCSGYDPETAQSGFMLQRRLRMIEKPFLEDTLLRTVREVLDEEVECSLAVRTGI